MDGWWVVIGILLCIIVVLLIKVILLRKAAHEIETGFSDRLTTDTNTLIDISTGDRAMRSLANTINEQLRLLRSKRHCYEQGDRELKTAVTNISHDLRTPLTAILGYLDLLEREEKSQKVSEYLAIIRERTSALKDLTEELFRYSMIQSTSDELVMKEVCLNDTLEVSLAGYYGALTERGIIPDIQMTEEPVIRYLDPNALSRIFSNVLNNAVKYSDGDLSVILSADGTVRFRNSAKGLTHVEVQKLFDRFYTVENAHNSTGLGLSIAKLLTEKMGGSIEAEYVENSLCISIKF